jgi:HlyD family secretion protein
MKIDRRWIQRGAILLAVLVLGVVVYVVTRPDTLPDGIESGNGRIEAIEVDISAKTPGRIREILADEGDSVRPGQIVARIDTDAMQAQRSEAEAQLAQAINAIAIAQSQVRQAEDQRRAALALQRQREAELDAARKRFARSETLAREGATAVQERDDNQAQVEGAQAGVEAARAQVEAATAAVGTARGQVIGARAHVEAARATIRRLDVDIADSDLRSPVQGRVQYRVAQPGEVLGAGGRVLNLVNLADVYMTFFLPETVAGKVAVGSEARIVLDALPDRVIPARISFVSDVAQFTPKTVETKSERQKLMFRLKAQIDPQLLQRNIARVKTGLPGVAYVRVDPRVDWPAELRLDGSR